MKKILYSSLVLIFMASCGGGTTESNREEGTSRIDTTNTDSDYRPDSLPVDDAQVPIDGTTTEQDTV